VEGFVEGETHNTQVQKVYTTGESEWASFDWVYTPCDNFAGLQADPTAEWQGTDVVLNWVLPGGDGPTPPPTPPTGDDNFSFDFEGGMNGWTTIDVDGDGLFWNHSTNSLTYSGYDYTGLGHNGSNGFAYSQSYIDYDGSYDPNNYLISPQKYVITSGSTLTFWADNANDSYPDHFGVAVATADNPTPNDFTIVWEGGAKGAAGKAAVRHDNNRYNNWRQHTVNLGAYAGQAVWIASVTSTAMTTTRSGLTTSL
jgi:Cleaved Adhesin Domain.